MYMLQLHVHVTNMYLFETHCMLTQKDANTHCPMVVIAVRYRYSKSTALVTLYQNVTRQLPF